MSGLGYVSYTNIHENTSNKAVTEAGACTCTCENDCDSILALGGGTVLDSAMMINSGGCK